MSQRSSFQIQILEKLGAPLLLAAADVAARESNAAHQDDRKHEAQQVAVLLNRSVQASVGLASSMDLKDSESHADAVRLALAGVIGRLVAGQYKAAGKVPSESDVKRLVKALEAVLTFSDNFAPDAANTVRLENIEPGMVIDDESQTGIQLVCALVPVVNAVAVFPFGRPENKLVQEVSGQLVLKAKAINDALGGGTDSAATRRGELKILEALALVYAECHREQTGRLMAMSDEEKAGLAETAGGVLPMDDVWRIFDQRAAMIELVAKTAAPSTVPAPVNVSSVPPSLPPEPPPEMPPEPPAEQQAQESDPSAPDMTEQAGSEPFNPMGFFKPGAQKAPDHNDSSEDV